MFNLRSELNDFTVLGHEWPFDLLDCITKVCFRALSLASELITVNVHSSTLLPTPSSEYLFIPVLLQAGYSRYLFLKGIGRI